MPVSTPAHITHCVQRIQGLNPKSVLDVGCGFGLWGFLCREYLDIWNTRLHPADWQVRIDGIELFEPYIQAHQRALYSNIIIGDVRDAIKKVGDYDLIIAGDVIEHLDKPDAEDLLDCLYQKARKALMVNIPLGGNWDHPEEHGNPGELHRSQWSLDDFAPYPCEFTGFKLPCGDYGVFICPKPAPEAERINGLLYAAELRVQRGNPAAALRFLWQAYDLDPANIQVLTALSDVLLTQGDAAKAIETISAVVLGDAGAAETHLLLARTLFAAQRYAEAGSELARLLQKASLPPSVAASAQALLAEVQTRPN